MLQGEHSAIISTFIKLTFVIKTFVLTIFEWLFYTGFTVSCHFFLSWESYLLHSEVHKYMLNTVDGLKFWTIAACQKSLDKQCSPRSDCFWRSSLIRAFTVCYSYKHFMNSSLDNQNFITKTNTMHPDQTAHLQYKLPKNINRRLKRE